ncbi:MAG: non-homologous end-joining DNA ligase [Acidimicrobiales bacterium]|nr:non-homologous end-joining DNA ligase [Acidimicrobiales bacterium]
MTATVGEVGVLGDGWRFERKLDGFRCLAWVDGTDARLRSRSGQSFDEALPELRAAISDQTIGRAILDGELVGYDAEGTSFQQLQRRIGRRPQPGAGAEVAVGFVAFDLLWFADHDLRPLDLDTRVSTLREVVTPGGLVALSEPLEGDGPALLADACARGWEGLVAKRRGSTYVGRRSGDWRKIKCTRSQEVVVGGWTDPQGSRDGLGALLVGVHDAAGLRYAGRVGTGFDAEALRALPPVLASLERVTSPFVDAVRERGAHWIEPQIVIQVDFREWSDAGRLRNPSFRGLRDDKQASEVIREGQPPW